MSGDPGARNGSPPPVQERQETVRKPSVFISYSRRERELEVAQALEQGLMEAGVGVWRDESQLVAGQPWPTVLGKALEGCDCLVLIWSEHSAASEHVEREWNAAIALKKAVLPYRLDNAPLPALLLGSHFIDASDPKAAVERIATSLKVREGTGKSEARGSGSTAPGPGRGRRVAWAGLAVVVLALIVLMVWWKENPGLNGRQGGGSPAVQPAEQGVVQELAGFIRDEHGDPVPNVEVSLPKLGAKATTDPRGYFHLQARAEKQVTVDLMAQKDGYETYEAYATLGNTGFDFTMKKR